MCLRRAPEKHIAGAALDRAALRCLRLLQAVDHCSGGFLFNFHFVLAN
jgi:hypothetical protein